MPLSKPTLTRLGLALFSLAGMGEHLSAQISSSGNVVPGSATSPVWSVNGTLTVGNSSTGNLTIASGGLVTATETVVGNDSGAVGNVTISGGNLTNTGTLAVGYSGGGRLNLGSGNVTDDEGQIGVFSGSNGAVSVSGGSWVNRLDLRVGFGGNGTLQITSGSVSNLDAYIGQFSSSRGNVTVSGGTWTNNGSIIMANSAGAVGQLTLQGGVVSANQISEGGGSGTVAFNGGTLQLRGNQTSLFSDFESGDVTLGTSGGTIDTQSFSVETSLGLTGNGPLTKLGSGTLTLSGSHSYVGTTIVRQGTLAVTGSLGSNSADVTVGEQSGDQASLAISGSGSVSGDFVFLGSDFGATGEVTVAGGTFNASELTVGRGGTGSVTLSNGMMSSGIAFVGGFGGAQGSVTVQGGNWTNTQAIRLGQLSGSTGTLQLRGGVVTTAQVSEGGGSGNVTFNGGTLRLNANQSSLFSGFETGDVRVVSAGGTIDTQEFNVATSVGIGGNGSLTKLGSGTLTLTGNNTYTGSTIIRSGTLAVDGGGALSSLANPAVRIRVGNFSGDNGTLTIGNGTVTNVFTAIAFVSGSTGAVNVNGGTWIQYSLIIGDVGNGTLAIGNGTVNSEEVEIGRSGGSTGTVSVTGGNWTTGGSGFFTVGVSGTGSLTIAGGAVSNLETQIAHRSTGNGTLNLNGGTLTTGQIFEGSGNGTVTFNGGTLRLSGNRADLFSGFESGDVTTVGSGATIDTRSFSVGTSYGLSGNGSLNKTGNGTLTLAGTNTHTGSTLVTAGTLVVNGAINNSTVTVADGATLAGNGFIKQITLEDGATASPGNSIGTLFAESLNWNAGAGMDFELGNATSDLVDLSGAFTKSGTGDFLFTFVNLGWQIGQTYTLVEFGSTNFLFSDFGYTNSGGFAGTFALDADSLDFTLTVIPEPSTVALLLGAAVLLVLRLRRRTSSSDCIR